MLKFKDRISDAFIPMMNLNTDCWQCGEPDISVDQRGPIICQNCMRSRVPGRDMYLIRNPWLSKSESERMRTCWLCCTEAVDVNDELGLCHECLERLKQESND